MTGNLMLGCLMLVCIVMQMFMFHHPKHGVVDYKPITLE